MIELTVNITPELDTDDSYPSAIEFEVEQDRTRVSMLLGKRTVVFSSADIKQLASILLEE